MMKCEFLHEGLHSCQEQERSCWCVGQFQ